MDKEIIIKNLADEIRNSCRIAFDNRWKNDKDNRKILENQMNAILKTYIIEGALEPNIKVKLTGEKDIIYTKFYYNDRELYLEDMSQLANFNPYDYQYIDENGIIRNCETSPMTISFSLDDNEVIENKDDIDLLKDWCVNILDNYKPSEWSYQNRFNLEYEKGVTDTLKKVICKINKLKESD